MNGKNTRRNIGGFTLVEMLIAVVVLGILVAASMPSYVNQVRKSRRADAMTALTDLSGRQERFVAQNGVYTVTVDAFAGLNYGSTSSPEGFYTLSSAACGTGTIATCYVVSATPVGDQADDAICATLSLGSNGLKSASGSTPSNCW